MTERPSVQWGDPRLPSRFWGKVVPEPNSGCWLWVGATSKGGYGACSLAGIQRYTHRLAYESLVGPIPGALQIDHLCRTRCCCNPVHLEPVTVRENAVRGVSGKVNAARQRAITHCPHGHPYDDTNTSFRVQRNRARRCKTCARDYFHRRKHGARAAG